MLLPTLDELDALSVDGELLRFHRMQSLWFAVVGQIAPFVRVTRTRQPTSQRAHIHPTHSRARRFTLMRPEARTALDMLRSDITAPWTLDMLADAVHLSSKQFGHVFPETFRKTPLAYLTRLRGEKMSACSLIAVSTVRRNMCGVIPVMPARSSTCRSWRRTLFVVNDAPPRLQNNSASNEVSSGLVSLRRTASAVNDWIATVRRDFAVFG